MPTPRTIRTGRAGGPAADRSGPRCTALRRSRRGMTLIEVMVSLVILLVMSAVIFQSLHNSIEFHNLLSARDETVRTARAALSRISHDLQLAYLTPNREAINSYQTVFVGLEEDPSKLYFASLGHQRLYLDSRECDQTEITLWAEEAPEDRGRGYILYHRESPRIDQYPDEQGVIWPLAYNVRSFTLRYLDQATQEWKTSWDTRSSETPYRLPRAVEIGLVLIAQDPSDPTGETTVDVPFLTTVILEYAERLPPSASNPLAQMNTSPGGESPPGTPPMPPTGAPPSPWGGGGGGGGGGPWGGGGGGGGSLWYGGNGGFGGMGFGGLTGGTLGGTLGALPGAQSGKGSGRAPARPPSRGGPGGVPGGGPVPGGGGRR